MLLAAPGLQAQDESVEQRMLGRVYGEGGQTLFCQTSFENGDNITMTRVYQQQQILENFDCVSEAQCKTRQAYRDAISDPHNIYPVKQKALLDRRGTRFGDLPEDVQPASGDCPYQLSFQTFEPPENARGNVARAMFYMHETHDLPLVGSEETFKRWNRQDPPDEQERARNDAIKAMTGRSNPFIDNPDRARQVGDETSSKRLQFGG